MIFQNIQFIYYMNGRKVFNQSGETDIKTIEANNINGENKYDTIKKEDVEKLITRIITNFQTLFELLILRM